MSIISKLNSGEALLAAQVALFAQLQSIKDGCSQDLTKGSTPELVQDRVILTLFEERVAMVETELGELEKRGVELMDEMLKRGSSTHSEFLAIAYINNTFPH